MIRDLKKGLRLLTYSFQFLLYIIWTIFLEVGGLSLLGVWMLSSSHSPGEYDAGAIVFVIMVLLFAPLMLNQLGISLECSGIVLSSRLHKTLGVHLPDIICIATAIETIILLTVTSVIFGHTMVFGELIFLAGILTFVIFVYAMLSSRYFLTAIVVYVAGYLSVSYLALFIFSHISENTVLHGGTGAALGILIMVAGLALCSLLRRFLYKKPVAKSAVSRTLRKYM